MPVVCTSPLGPFTTRAGGFFTKNMDVQHNCSTSILSLNSKYVKFRYFNCLNVYCLNSIIIRWPVYQQHKA